MTRDVGVVIVAGGGSTRTSGTELKQFRWVAGKPALLHSLQTFMAREDVSAETKQKLCFENPKRMYPRALL